MVKNMEFKILIEKVEEATPKHPWIPWEFKM
jgi:hypothetical protein